MDEVIQIKAIKGEIFRRIKDAKNLEIVHWYISLDECFENDEFHKSEAENLRWRLFVLQEKKEPLGNLFALIEPLLQYYGLLDAGKQWTKDDNYTPQKQAYSKKPLFKDKEKEES